METRLCTKSNHYVEIDQFNKNPKTGKIHPWCKSCVKEYDHNRHQSQAPRIRSLKKKRRAEIRQWMLDLKSTLKCERCPENDPACLVFHHTNPEEKEVNVADAVKSGWGRERILAEVAKCIVLCANCHLKLHTYE